MPFSHDGVFFKDYDIWAKPLPEETVSDLARRCGIMIDQPCGGCGSCGKCGVLVDGVYALACQTMAVAGMQITMPNCPDKMQILESAEGMMQGQALKCGKVGAALDIGTTTLVLYLVDCAGGDILAVSSSINPQTAFGADVISRISYIETNEDGLQRLRGVLINKINIMLDDVLQKASLHRGQVSAMVVAGNTTMEHIFAGVSPAAIGRAPFKPVFSDSIIIAPQDAGINLGGGTMIRLLPNISGFVGGDIVSGILYSKMAESDKLSLLVDIGTNNEMVLGSRDFLLCCSAAAGPALEGAKISQGMRAAPGAVDSVVSRNGDLHVTTIDNVPARGICGSGLVDAVAELFRNGVIAPSGKFTKAEKISSEPLRKRLSGSKASEMFYTLVNSNGHAIGLTQQDIREVQLAKGAIAAGIEIMLEEAGMSLRDIDRVFVAGAFGNYLNFVNAIELGILPNVPEGKITALGNSAGLGACQLLCGEDCWADVSCLSATARHIELAEHPRFQEVFVRSLSFNSIEKPDRETRPQ